VTVSNLAFVLRRQHGHGVAAKVRAGQRDDMHLVARDEGGQMRAELVVLIDADMMKFVDRDRAIVEGLDAEFVDRETKGRQASTRSSLRKNSPTAFTLDLAMRGSSTPGALQRFQPASSFFSCARLRSSGMA
jgi:hypothetical protein